MLYMLDNISTGGLKQFSHLLLRQPYGLIYKAHVNLSIAIICLINDYFALYIFFLLSYHTFALHLNTSHFINGSDTYPITVYHKALYSSTYTATSKNNFIL